MRLYENRPGGQAALVDYVRRNASSCAGARPPTSQCRHKAYHFTDIAIQPKALPIDTLIDDRLF